MDARRTPSIPLDSARHGLVRLGWIALGSVALALGAVGILLPVLPTTPFVILAAFAFARSAPSLQARLERSRTFGPVIADWRASGAIAPRYKCFALAMMTGALLLSTVLAMPATVLAIQAACMAAAALFILTRPSRAA